MYRAPRRRQGLIPNAGQFALRRIFARFAPPLRGRVIAAIWRRMAFLALRLEKEKATAGFGAALAPVLRRGDVIGLSGPLGAGKTALARGLIAVFAGACEVPSPTYTLVETYAGDGADLWHFDLYRLEKPADVWELGLEEALEDGICLIEWPDRIEKLLPEGALRLELAILENGARQLMASGPETWRVRLRAAGIA